MRTSVGSGGVPAKHYNKRSAYLEDFCRRRGHQSKACRARALFKPPTIAPIRPHSTRRPDLQPSVQHEASPSNLSQKATEQTTLAMHSHLATSPGAGQLDPMLVRQLVSVAMPGTASTLQFQVLCAIMYLLHPHATTCVFKDTGKHSLFVRPPPEGLYEVIKTHAAWVHLPPNASLQTLWLFGARNSGEIEGANRSRDVTVRGGSRIRWPIMYMQSQRALAKKGARAVVARYADIFHLNEQHRAQLWEYIEPWQLLRQCCGTQMSGAWRVVLQSHRRHDPSSHLCARHDLRAVEWTLMRSDVFRKLGPMGPAQLVSPDGASDTGVALSNRFDGTYCNRTNAAIEADQRVRFNARLPWPTETGPSHLQQRQGSIGPMPQSRIEASSEGALSRGHIPRIFLITDKAWSARVDKLNRSLARTHPGWPVLFFDDDMAEAFVKHHYPNMPYAKVFRQFRIPAHRADFFRYAALHAIGGYYVDADNRPVVNLEAVTRGLDFVTALDRDQGLIHNGFIAARPGSGITLRLLHDTAEKVRQSSLARYCYFVRSGLSVIASAIHLRPRRVRADTTYTAEGYNGSRRERVLFVLHDTRPTRHPNHTRAALWACGLNQRTATPAPAAEPRMNQCECMMHVAVHPTNYAEK